MLNYEKFVSIICEFADTNDYDMGDMYISHGGAMLTMGFKESTSDVDAHVTQEIWDDQLIKTGKVPVDLGNGVYLLEVDENIDIHIGATRPSELGIRTSPSGYRYSDMWQTLDDYKLLNREKDQGSIMRLELEIASNHNCPFCGYEHIGNC